MPTILADGTISFLIYLAIAAIWVIGQVVQQKEAKRKAEEFKRKREEQARTNPPPARTEPLKKTLETELQEFLGRITGEPTPVAPPKPKPVVLVDPPKPPPVPKQAPKPTPAPAAPLPPLAHHMQRQAARISDLNTEDVYKTVEDLKDISDMDMDLASKGAISAEALLNVRTMMVDMSRVNVPMPRLQMRNNRSVLTKTSRPTLRDPRVLKRTIVGNLLLGSPKALQKDPFQAEQGGV